jgi:hypothetical protein
MARGGDNDAAKSPGSEEAAQCRLLGLCVKHHRHPNMIVITNRKIAELEPRWAPFSGFSLLFDNPGESLSPLSANLLKLDCSETAPELQLYSRLAGTLDRIGRDLLVNTYLLCPLPFYSYHVTVWDGLNDANAAQVLPQHQAELSDFLQGLPGSLLTDERFTAQASDSLLVRRRDWAIKFKFDVLYKWDNRALVALLAPADEDSESKLRTIVVGREGLTTGLQEQFGVRTTGGFAPHVTLGYYANREHAEHSTPQIDRWSELIQEEAGDLTITFRTIGLYGFTDMVTFFRGGPSRT